MDLLSLLIGIVVGLIAGLLAARLLFSNQKNSTDEQSNQHLLSELAVTREKRDELSRENARLQVAEAQLLKDNEFLSSRLKETEERFEERRKSFEEEVKRTTEHLQQQFQVMANRILEEKSERFTKTNTEKISAILDPLKLQIGEFKQRVETVYDVEGKERASLKKEIEHLVKMNQELNEGARNLTNALKGDAQKQGMWGEEQLKVILEKAGLTEGVHYDTQQTFRDEDGDLKKPDFLIRLPQDKHLIIDAKVSLTAYERYHNAEDELERQTALDQHLASLRKHIKDLGKREYEKLYDIHTPDFVLMYVPIEPALTLGLSSASALYEEALRQNVVLVSTTTLLATMRTVRYIWTQEDQRQNIQRIIQQTERLYDKFRGFTDDLLKIGKHFNDGQKTYEEAMGKLSTGRGNLVRQVELIRELSSYQPKNPVDPELVERSGQRSLESNGKTEDAEDAEV